MKKDQYPSDEYLIGATDYLLEWMKAIVIQCLVYDRLVDSLRNLKFDSTGYSKPSVDRILVTYDSFSHT